MVAAMASTAAVAMTTIMRLGSHDLFRRLIVFSHHQSEQTRDGEEDAVHDAKSE